ncbi:hypothetical protein HMPREF0083_02845 [Aneurinibacillus aneurinilyticus ATCC 12856]|uniref:Uncharacterized protein n=1 Tax=Aneurinibacillus aneurinilyticus ATCC 12856 TaxID=649747 RepID=U1YA96_ANEAE|nr:hypothetical protein HMPREF0083_02845 [Aneurinibacillus aneurinilyticus ATCC 12856]
MRRRENFEKINLFLFLIVLFVTIVIIKIKPPVRCKMIDSQNE